MFYFFSIYVGKEHDGPGKDPIRGISFFQIYIYSVFLFLSVLLFSIYIG